WYRRAAVVTRSAASDTVAEPSSVTQRNPSGWQRTARPPTATFRALRAVPTVRTRAVLVAPSQVNRTGATCGVPSGRMVVRVAIRGSARKASTPELTGVARLPLETARADGRSLFIVTPLS